MRGHTASQRTLASLLEFVPRQGGQLLEARGMKTTTAEWFMQTSQNRAVALVAIHTRRASAPMVTTFAQETGSDVQQRAITAGPVRPEKEMTL